MLAILVTILTSGCNAADRTPTAVISPVGITDGDISIEGGNPVGVFAVPVPVAPIAGMRVLQNDPATQCPFNPSRGFGYQATFSWTAVVSPQPASGYQVVVFDPIGAEPVIRTRVSSTSLLVRRCNTVVDVALLDNWRWRVRAQFADGSYGSWSGSETFGFLPRRTNELFSLRPPNYGSGKTQVSRSGVVDPLTSDVVDLSTRTQTSTAVAAPPEVEFYWSDGSFFVPLGLWTRFSLFDQGATRFWTSFLTWDPDPSVPLGARAVVGTWRTTTGMRFVATMGTVQVVP